MAASDLVSVRGQVMEYTYIPTGIKGEIGNRASEGQAAGVYGAGFTAGSLAGKGARGGTRGTGNKVSS